MRPDDESLALLRGLHDSVFVDPEVRAVLDATFAELTAELRSRPAPPYATRMVPIELFTDGLPVEAAKVAVGDAGSQSQRVRLCRAFLLRRGARMGTPERHRNSVQRLVSYRGRGRIHQGGEGGGPGDLRPRAIYSPGAGDRGPDAPGGRDIGRFWDIVPPVVWHYPEAGVDEDWATVTFHSAGETDILDELWEG